MDGTSQAASEAASGETATRERVAHSFFGRRPDSEPARATGRLACDRVIGDFRLLKLLGQGGMGQVWEAEQLSLGGRRVAIKFVWPDRMTARDLELFQREARAGGRLSNPGIVALHAYGESDGLAWIAMELVEGAWTLRDFLDATARVEELPASYDRDVARLVAEVAEAMETAHAAGVIHRDLKPQNMNPSELQPSHVSVSSLLHPVEHVRWLECRMWLARAGLSLPTEAQWEYACRAGTQTPWWTGEDASVLGDLCVSNLQTRGPARLASERPSVQDVFVFHAPVGSFAANDFGLHDVHGNVSEWCRDAYQVDFYARAPAEDPVLEGDEDALRVHRGGSFMTPAELARSSLRQVTQAPLEALSVGVRPGRELTR